MPVETIPEIARFINDMANTPYAQAASLVGTTFGIKDGILGISKLSKEQKFIKFFVGFNADNTSVMEEKKLIEYLRVPQNLDIISNIIEGSIRTQSRNCSYLLGLVAKKCLSGGKDISYEDIILSKLLVELVDKDIENFVFIYEFICKKLNIEENTMKIDSGLSWRIEDMKEELMKLDKHVFEIEILIEKLKNLYVLSYDIGGWGNSGNSRGLFELNMYTETFYNLIKKIPKE